MNRIITLSCCLGLVAFAACGRSPGMVGSGKILVTVGNSTITEGDLQQLAEVATPQVKQQLNSPGGRRQIINSLIERELLYSASTAQQLDRDPKLQTQIALHTRSLIAQAALNAATEVAAQGYYDSNPAEFETVALSHLLIKFGALPPEPGSSALDRMVERKPKSRTEAEAVALANDIKARIAQGEPFPKLAKELSDDFATRMSGGGLGQVWRKEPRLMRQGLEELLTAAFTLQPGTVGGPLKTTAGYHLFQIAEAPKKRSFDDAKAALIQRFAGKTRDDYLAKLRTDKRVVYIDTSLAPPTPPVATPPAAPVSQPVVPANPAAPENPKK